MGNRANLLVVDPHGCHLHYSHWAASGLLPYLAAGPEPTLRFIRGQARAESLLDDTWAEAGVLVDLVRRTLLWYAMDVVGEIPARRAYQRVLALTWPGWRIEWAPDGQGDLAAAVGFDRAAVRAVDLADLISPPTAYEDPPAPGYALHPGLEHDIFDLVTVRTNGPVSVWRFDHRYDGHPAWLGPSMLEQLPGAGVPRVDLAALPMSGLHVDVPSRWIGFWASGTVPGLLSALGDRWPGWTVRWWDDRYERQAEAADEAVTVPRCDERAAVAMLTDILAKRPVAASGPPGWVTEIVAEKRTSGVELRLNPVTDQHVGTGLSDRESARLDQVLAEVAGILG